MAMAACFVFLGPPAPKINSRATWNWSPSEHVVFQLVRQRSSNRSACSSLGLGLFGGTCDQICRTLETSSTSDGAFECQHSGSSTFEMKIGHRFARWRRGGGTVCTMANLSALQDSSEAATSPFLQECREWTWKRSCH